MTTDAQSALDKFDFRLILNSLGDGILIFNKEGQLLFDNEISRAILGADLVVIRAEGWPALAMIMDAAKTDDAPIAEEIRAKALRQTESVRFNILLSNAYTPCWASAIHGPDDSVYLMIEIERPDWKPLTELMNTFRSEASMAINSTKNHADLILRLANTRPPDMTTDQLAERILGFSELMSTDMYRLQNLLEQLHRLEIIRTGQLYESVRKTQRSISLQDFVEDFLEEVVEKPITDSPPKGDLRDYIDVDIPSNLKIFASRSYLEFIFRDILRNAVMYSEKGTPIKIRASSVMQGEQVLIEVQDVGYGIREKENDRVFKPFQRARQPHIIAEFGYGLSLYLSKANIEAMDGKLWYESEEGVGTTFKMQLPAPKVES